MSERTSYDARDALLGRPGDPRHRRLGRVLRRAVRLGDAGAARTRADRRLPPGEEERQGRRRGDAADAGGPAAGLERPTSRSTTPTATAAAVTEAGGSVIVEPMDVMDLGTDGGLRRPDRRRLRRSGSRAPSPAPSSSTSPARSPGTSSTPATRPPPRRSTAPSSAGAPTSKTWGRRAPTRLDQARRANRSAACSTSAAGVPDEVPAHWLVYFAVEDTDATVEKVKERRRRASCSARSTSRSAASRSSPTRTAPSSR